MTTDLTRADLRRRTRAEQVAASPLPTALFLGALLLMIPALVAGRTPGGFTLAVVVAGMVMAALATSASRSEARRFLQQADTGGRR